MLRLATSIAATDSSSEAAGLTAYQIDVIEDDTQTISGTGGGNGTLTVHAHLNVAGDLDSFLLNYGRGAVGIDAVSVVINGRHVPQGSPPYPQGYGYSGHSFPGPAYGHEVTTTEPLVLQIPFTYTVEDGQATQVGYGFTLFETAEANNAGDGTINFASAAADLGDTVSWGGIDSVTGADGNPVADSTITSGSGFDYARPFIEPNAAVPEPASGMLLLTMLGGCGALRRRRPRAGVARAGG